MAHRTRPRAPIRVLAIASMLAIAAPSRVSAAVPAMSFGTVSVGESKLLSATVPLQSMLHELPSGTLIYTGGISAIDQALAFNFMTLPVTAGSLIARTGDLTVNYHLTPHVSSIDFQAEAPTCLTGFGSCTVQVTFAPTSGGTKIGQIHWTMSDVQVVGGGSLASLVQLLGPFIGNQFDGSHDIGLSGLALPTSESVTAVVDIAASAACIELSTSAINFGSTTLGAESVPANPTITVTNCSGGSETLYARGSDASGPNSVWSLVDTSSTCATDLGLDRYRMALATEAAPDGVSLSTLNKALQSLASGEDMDQVAAIWTACPGSSGAGVVMTMQIHYLVAGE